MEARRSRDSAEPIAARMTGSEKRNGPASLGGAVLFAGASRVRPYSLS